MTAPVQRYQPDNANPSQNAVTGSSGTHPVPEGAADNAPPAIRDALAIAAIIDPVAFDPVSLGGTHPSWQFRRETATDTANKILALRATPSDIERAFTDACDEAGCAYDNEALLQAISDLKAHAQCGVQTDDVAGRRKRLNETVERIGKALEAGRALASIFPLEKDAMPQAVAVVEQRRSLLNVACHEFKTTFLHDLAAVTSSLSSANRVGLLDPGIDGPYNEPCEHKSVHDGPRIEMRWGTAPTQVCDCGMWRTNLHVPGIWRAPPVSSTHHHTPTESK